MCLIVNGSKVLGLCITTLPPRGVAKFDIKNKIFEQERRAYRNVSSYRDEC